MKKAAGMELAEEGSASPSTSHKPLRQHMTPPAAPQPGQESHCTIVLPCGQLPDVQDVSSTPPPPSPPQGEYSHLAFRQSMSHLHGCSLIKKAAA